MRDKIRKALSILFFAGSLLVIHSCNDVQPDFLLKVYVPYATHDQWIIVSDQNGRLLSYKPANEKGTVVFKGLPSQKVIMTTFRGSDYFSLQSVYALPIGTEITDTIPASSYQSPPAAKGTASFTIKDFALTPDNISYPGPASLLYSADFGEQYQSSTLFNFGTSLTYDGSTLSFDFTLKNNQSDILGVTYRNGLPVYKWFNGVKPGDVITTSLNDFSLSKTIPINKSVNFLVVGQSGAKSYTLSYQPHWYLSKTSDKSKIPLPGYIDGFEKYITSVSKTDNYFPERWQWFTYDRSGSIPTSIDVPDYNISIPDKTMSNFSFKFDKDYTYMVAYFSIDGKSSGLTKIWWTNSAPPNEKIVVIEFPGEILSKYPTFSTDKLRVNMIQFIKENGGDTFIDRVTHVYKQRTSYETTRYQITYYNN